MFLRLVYISVSVAAVASAYSTPARPAVQSKTTGAKSHVAQAFATAAASASLAFVLVGSPLHANAMSKTAGQISLNTIPPTSVKVDVKDLPIVGDIFSGTYTRVNDADVTSPSVSIKSPKDKVGAIKAVATGGHLEFDVDRILATHIDIDVAADEAGVLTARVSSPLIPKLPFKNSASSADSAGKGRSSDWSKVTNLGDGDVYYFNSKTDVTQNEKPNKF